MSFRLLLSLTLLPLLVSAQQNTNERVLARAELANKEIEIGDQLFLKVNLSAPPGTEIEGLDASFINGLTGIELVDAKALNVVAETPERLLEQRFLITSFDTGYIGIEPLPYIYKAADGRVDTAYTNDLLLRVRAYPVEDDSELQPIKPIFEEGRNWLDFWPLYLVLLLAAGGYGLYVLSQRRKRIAPPPPPPPPADLQALNRLKELEARELWQQGETKVYYTELTDILRTYLQDEFGVKAREMTSRQIATALRKNVGMKEAVLAELSELLQLSDLVKFAKATPAEELHPRSLERVREFVRESAIKAPPPPPEVEAVAAAAVVTPAVEPPPAPTVPEVAATDDPAPIVEGLSEPETVEVEAAREIPVTGQSPNIAPAAAPENAKNEEE